MLNIKDLPYSVIENGDYFRIDQENGEIYTDQIFDRETIKTIPITVKATDLLSNFPIQGICSFDVKIIIFHIDCKYIIIITIDYLIF